MAACAGTADAETPAPPERAEPRVVLAQELVEAPAPEAPRDRAIVKFVIFGEFPEDLEQAVAQGLEDELQVRVERLGQRALPRAAYYPPRRRYRADRLLDYLRDLLEGEPPTTRVLGFTAVDISTTNGRHRDWGIFGLGDMGGRACVISSFRLRRRARDAEHLRFRVVSTAVHEVGHTLGLDHCVEDRCVMNDAEGSIATVDRSTGHLGPQCRAEVGREAPRILPRPPP